MIKYKVIQNSIYGALPSSYFCDKIKGEKLSEEQCTFLKSILPLIKSEDNESLLLGVFYLKEEGWDKNITADYSRLGYTIHDLICIIEQGITLFSAVLDEIISIILRNKVYYVHSYLSDK